MAETDTHHSTEGEEGAQIRTATEAEAQALLEGEAFKNGV